MTCGFASCQGISAPQALALPSPALLAPAVNSPPRTTVSLVLRGESARPCTPTFPAHLCRVPCDPDVPAGVTDLWLASCPAATDVSSPPTPAAAAVQGDTPVHPPAGPRPPEHPAPSVISSFFCPANTSSVVGNECPAGHYCPAATSSASQFPCPRGTYRPQTGGVQPSDCALCEPGKAALCPTAPPRP